MKSIVLSGGGALGSFEAGFLFTIFDYVKFDNICGTSVGSLNGALLAQAYLENNRNVIYDVWMNKIQKNKDVYTTNYFKIFTNSAPFSFNPLKKIIKETISFDGLIAMEQTLRINTTDLGSGELKTFSNKDEDIYAEKLLNALMASSSIPPVFPYVTINGNKYVDGGLRANIPIINILSEKDNDYALILISFRPNLKTEIKEYGLIETSMRAINILTNEVSRGDLRELDKLHKYGMLISNNKEMEKNPETIEIDIVQPLEDPCPDVLDFSHASLQQGFEEGVKYAEKYMNKDFASTFTNKYLIQTLHS